MIGSHSAIYKDKVWQLITRMLDDSVEGGATGDDRMLRFAQ